MTKHVSNIVTTNCNIQKLFNVKKKRGSYQFSHEFVAKSLSRVTIGKMETLEVLKGKPEGTGITRGNVLSTGTPL